MSQKQLIGIRSNLKGLGSSLLSVVMKSSSNGHTNDSSKNSSNNTDNNQREQEGERRLIDSLIDDVIFCECLQVHRAAKMGMIFTEACDEMYRIKEGSGLDVFGQPLNKKKQLNCTCPQCGRNIAASRLAPHLEKCMGMGRLSARAASNKRDTSSSQM